MVNRITITIEDFEDIAQELAAHVLQEKDGSVAIALLHAVAYDKLKRQLFNGDRHETKNDVNEVDFYGNF